jgi:hypothetical protein
MPARTRHCGQNLSPYFRLPHIYPRTSVRARQNAIQSRLRMAIALSAKSVGDDASGHSEFHVANRAFPTVVSKKARHGQNWSAKGLIKTASGQ